MAWTYEGWIDIVEQDNTVDVTGECPPIFVLIHHLLFVLLPSDCSLVILHSVIRQMDTSVLFA